MGFILFNVINWPISHTQIPGTHDINHPPTPPPPLRPSPSMARRFNNHLWWTERGVRRWETDWRLAMLSSTVWVGILRLVCVRARVCVRGRGREREWEGVDWIIDKLPLSMQKDVTRCIKASGWESRHDLISPHLPNKHFPHKLTSFLVFYSYFS